MRSGRRRRHHISAEISMTNLIDVAFVLLIIFMITAPIMQGGIEVQLPEAESDPIEATDAITLSITERGEMFLGETAVTMGELRSVLESQRAARPNAPVNIQVDKNS